MWAVGSVSKELSVLCANKQIGFDETFHNGCFSLSWKPASAEYCIEIRFSTEHRVLS